MKKQPEFMVNATNVYRTKHFIVRQRIGVLYSISDHNVLYSRDTYYEGPPSEMLPMNPCSPENPRLTESG